MKLFTEAGKDNAKLSINVVLIDWDKLCSPFFKSILGISLGFTLCLLVLPQMGMDLPEWTTLLMVLLIAYMPLCMLWYIFHPKIVEFTIKQNESPTEFMVNPHQLLWVTPAGDIPIFKKGYRVEKALVEGVKVYNCYGKSNISMSHAVRHLMVYNKIWHCNDLMCQLSVDAEKYPEAYSILEAKCTKRDMSTNGD